MRHHGPFLAVVLFISSFSLTYGPREIRAQDNCDPAPNVPSHCVFLDPTYIHGDSLSENSSNIVMDTAYIEGTRVDPDSDATVENHYPCDGTSDYCFPNDEIPADYFPGIGADEGSVENFLCGNNCTRFSPDDSPINPFCNIEDMPDCAGADVSQDPFEDAPDPFSEIDPDAPSPFEGEQEEGGDPVILSSGAVTMQPQDISYPGPVLPLEFRRYYTSQSDARSSMGSNWSHTYDVTVRPLTEKHPLAKYNRACFAEGARCLIVSRHGHQSVFVKLMGTAFYIRPSGGAETIAPDGAGWQVTFPNGLKERFNQLGYLIESRDRYGNGYTVTYERTPLYRLYERYCSSDSVITLRDPRVCGILEAIFEAKPQTWQTWGPLPRTSLYTKKCYAVWSPIGPYGYDWINRTEFFINQQSLEQCAEDGRLCTWCTPELDSPIPDISLTCEPDIMKAEINEDLGDPPPTNQFHFVSVDGFFVDSVAPWNVAFRWGALPTAAFSKTFFYGLRLRTNAEMAGNPCSDPNWDETKGYPPRPRPSSLSEWITVDKGLLYHDVTLPDEEEYAALYASLSNSERQGLSAPNPEWLPEAYDTFAQLAKLGGITLSPLHDRDHNLYRAPNASDGGQMMRPIKVTDDLGRTLTFEYYKPESTHAARAGLLSKVTAPGNIRLEFYYERPDATSYPKYLNEYFLTEVRRYDGNTLVGDPIARPTLPNYQTLEYKVSEYTYQWATKLLHNTYQDHIQKLWSDFMSKDKDSFASAQALSYLSRVADNIIKVEHGHGLASRTVDLDTYYRSDPTDQSSFDRVVMQNFGDYDRANPYQDPYRLSYYEGYNANASLPDEIREAYPLESTAGSSRQYPTAVSSYVTNSVRDEYFKREYTYFNASANADTITRTPLTCSEISRVIHGEFALPYGEVLTTYRGLMRSNARRICAWTAETLQNGEVRYLGFNYQGNTLVVAEYDNTAAEHGGKQWIITEQIYDEDGNLTRSLTPRLVSQLEPSERADWQGGYKRFEYEGTPSYTAPFTAALWRSKNNKLVERQVAIGEGTSTFSVAGGENTIRGYFTSYAYEPYFNLIQRINTGFIRPNSTLDTEYVAEWVFWEGCGAGTPTINETVSQRGCPLSNKRCREIFEVERELQDLLLCAANKSCIAESTKIKFDRLIRYMKGLKVPAATVKRVEALQAKVPAKKTVSKKELSKLPAILMLPKSTPKARLEIARHNFKNRKKTNQANASVWQAQLSRELRLVQSELAQLIKSFTPILDRPGNRCVQKNAERLEFYSPDLLAEKRIVHLRYTALGMPLETREEKGRTTTFEYNGLKGNNRGLLSRIAMTRADQDYGAMMPADRCTNSGALAWLMAPNCQLRTSALLPNPLRSLVSGSASSTPLTVLEVAYSDIGFPKSRTENGLTTTYITDVDGRRLREKLPNGTQKLTRYNVEGLPVESTVFGASANDGSLPPRYERDVMRYSVSGHLTAHCKELEVGGCDGNFENSTLSNDPPQRQVTRFEYDRSGKETAQTRANGLRIESQYNGRGFLKTKRYLSAGDLSREVHVCHTLHGDIWRIIKGEKQNGCVADLETATFGLVKPEQECGPTSSDSYPRLVESFGFDGLGQKRSTLSDRLIVETNDFDEQGRLARIQTGTPACGKTWLREFAYSSHGEITRVSDNDLDVTEVAYGPWARSAKIDRTGYGTVYKIMTPTGETIWQRNGEGEERFFVPQELTRLRYDGVYLPDPVDPRLIEVKTSYDQNLLPIREEQTGRGLSSTFTLQSSISVERNPHGVVTLLLKPDSTQVTYGGANLLGWPYSICDEGECSALTYNVDGRPRTVTDAAGGITSFVWNRFEQKIGEKGPADVSPLKIIYDSLGRIIRHHKVSGSEREYEYDRRGDLVQITERGETSFYQSLDQLGRVETRSEHNGTDSAYLVMQMYDYDALGRVINERIKFPEAQKPYETTHNWELQQGRWQRTTTHPSGHTEKQRYDGTGNLTQFETEDLNWQWSGLVNRSATLRTVATGTDLQTKHTKFDSLLRVMQQRTELPDGSLLASFGLWRGTHGAIHAAREDLRFGANTRTEWFGFGYANGRVMKSFAHATNAALFPTTPTGTLTQSAAEGNFVAHGVASEGYTRESLGSLASVTAGDGTIRFSTPTRATGSRMNSVAIDGVHYAVAYDLEGNLTRFGNWEYRYDTLDRLTQALYNGTLREQYRYSAAGMLVAVLDGLGNVRFHFVPDGRKVVGAYLPGAAATPITQWEAFWNGEELFGWRKNGQTFLPIVDQRYSIRAIAPAGGAPTQVHDFDVDGNIRIQNGAGMVCESTPQTPCVFSEEIPFGYTGAWTSAETGLTFHAARWYHPTLRQFLSRDPIGYADSFDPYSYAAFDPINKFDPTGLDAIEAAQKCVDEDEGVTCVYSALTPDGRSLRDQGPDRIAFWDNYVNTMEDRLWDIVATHTAMNVAGEAAGAAFLRGLRWGGVKAWGWVNRGLDDMGEGVANSAMKGFERGVGELVPVPEVVRTQITFSEKGVGHTIRRHFSGINKQSRWTMNRREIFELLESKKVVSAPVEYAGHVAEGQYVRYVDTGVVVGRVRESHGRHLTTWIKVYTDVDGALISAYPVPGPAGTPPASWSSPLWGQ